MKMNDQLNSTMKNLRFSNKLFKLFHILKGEFNITYFIEFEDTLRDKSKILSEFIEKNPELNRFVFMSNSDMINNDLTEYVILHYGMDQFTIFHLLKVSNELGFTHELIDNNTVKLILK